MRAAGDLLSRVNRLARDRAPSDIARTALTPVLDEIQCRLAQQSQIPLREYLSPLETSRMDDEICDWLDDHGVSKSWSIAPALTAAGMDTARLEAVVNTLDRMHAQDSADLVFSWLANVIDAQHLINDVAEAGGRISELVEASKQYSHMDGSAFDVVDLHRLLDSTIDVLSPALGTDITVVRDYDPLLPGVPCYPGELTQAFTHIVSNGIDAMRSGDSDGRTLTLRTEMTGDAIHVEITDTGPGLIRASATVFLNPFSPPNPSARVPGSVSTSRGASSWTDRAGLSPCGRHRGIPDSPSRCAQPASRPADAPEIPSAARPNGAIVAIPPGRNAGPHRQPVP